MKLKTGTTSLLYYHYFPLCLPSIASVRVFADDVITTEVSEISTQEQKTNR